MRVEKKSYNEYWSEVQAYFGIKDTLKIVDDNKGLPEWEGDEVIEFRNSCGTPISFYNLDKEEALYF